MESNKTSKATIQCKGGEGGRVWEGGGGLGDAMT